MKNLISIILALFLLLISCTKKENLPAVQKTSEIKAAASQLSDKITEVLQTPSYTYLKLKNSGTPKWIAVTKREAKKGDTIYYEEGMEMQNFKSKTLNKTFTSIWFISKAGFVKNKSKSQAVTAHTMLSTHKKNMRKTSAQASINMNKNADEISIADLYKTPSEYEGKVIKIKGQVTKFNANILNRNWVHIQDGSEFNKKFDLTVTTTDVVNISDIVTFEGKISLNKNFGAGYKYEIIMEKAVKK